MQSRLGVLSLVITLNSHVSAAKPEPRRDVWCRTTPRVCFLVLLTFALKLSTASYLSHLTTSSSPDRRAGWISVYGGDTDSYIEPVDNYIQSGEYYSWNGKEKVKAGRMPYYGGLYFLFRMITDAPAARDLLVIAQILVEAISIVLLSILCFRLFATSSAFWIAYVLALVSLNSTIWSIYVLPESLAISLLFITLFHLQEYHLDDRLTSLALAGLFVTILVLLKPYFVLLYPAILLELFWSKGPRIDQGSLKRFVHQSLSLLGWLILLLSPWVVRNYQIYRRLIPFQMNITAGYNYTEAELACRRFVQAWGGSIIFWDKRSAGCYFQPQPGLACEFVLPDYALTPGYKKADIEAVRDDYVTLQHEFSDRQQQLVVARFDRLTNIYRAQRPFRYYVLSPITMAKAFVFHSGSYYLPIRLDIPGYHGFGLLIKLSQSFLYYFTLGLGSVGLLSLVVSHRLSLIYLFVPAMLIVLFCAVIRIPEFRYFVPTYPLFLLGTVHGVARMRRWVDKIRHPSLAVRGYD